MICVNVEDKTRTVLVVSEKGYGKRTAVEEYRVTNRGGKGVKTISVTEKTGNLVGILDVSEKEDLMITCVSGITIRTSIAQISEQGRATQGVKLIRLDDEDQIAAITNLDEVSEQPETEGIDTVVADATTDTTSTDETTPESPENNEGTEENTEN
jgi:DNA gyrase subunit A